MERREFLRTGSAGAGALGVMSLLPAEWALRGSRGRDAAAADGQAGALRLNSNENPLGLSPSARQAVIDGIPEANRYPRAARGRLVEALARRHGVPADRLVLGNGSTEVLQMSVQALGRPDSAIEAASTQPASRDREGKLFCLHGFQASAWKSKVLDSANALRLHRLQPHLRHCRDRVPVAAPAAVTGKTQLCRERSTRPSAV